MPDYYRYAATAAGLLQDIGRAKGMGAYGSAAALAPAISAIPGQIGGFLERRDQRAFQAQEGARQAEFDNLRRAQAAQQLYLNDQKINRQPILDAQADAASKQQATQAGQAIDLNTQRLAAGEAEAEDRKMRQIVITLAGEKDEGTWDRKLKRLEALGLDTSKIPEDVDQEWIDTAMIGAIDKSVEDKLILGHLNPAQPDISTADGFSEVFTGKKLEDQSREERLGALAKFKEVNRAPVKPAKLGSLERYLEDRLGPNPDPKLVPEEIARFNKMQGKFVPDPMIYYWSKMAAAGVPLQVAMKEFPTLMEEWKERHPNLDVEAARSTMAAAWQSIARADRETRAVGRMVALEKAVEEARKKGEPLPYQKPPRPRPGQGRRPGKPRKAEGGASGYTVAPELDGDGFVVTIPDGREFTAPTRAQAENFIRDMSGGK